VYEYDNAGNILKRKTYSYTTGTLPASPNTTYSYGYSSGAWGDQLTTYRGRTSQHQPESNTPKAMKIRAVFRKFARKVRT